MGKEYRIHLRGKQREQIDADLMAQLVVMLGRQLAQDAGEAIKANRQAEAEDARSKTEPEGNRPAQGGAA